MFFKYVNNIVKPNFKIIFTEKSTYGSSEQWTGPLKKESIFQPHQNLLSLSPLPCLPRLCIINIRVTILEMAKCLYLVPHLDLYCSCLDFSCPKADRGKDETPMI